MTGKTHLAIGAAVGAAASIYYPFTLEHAALFIAVAGFSALSADLDGPSMLSTKLSKISKLIRELTLWSGFLLAGIICYYFFTEQSPSPLYIGVAAALFLLGLVAKQGVIRNVLASVVGCHRHVCRLLLPDELAHRLRAVCRLGTVAEAPRHDAYDMGRPHLGSHWLGTAKSTANRRYRDRLHARLSYPIS